MMEPVAVEPTAARSSRARAALQAAAGTLWRLPGRFAIAHALGPRYSLRCVLFHDISDAESAFTRGLNITTSRSDFEAALKFLIKHYDPVCLDDVLAVPDGRKLPPRPVLVTFDDAYASIADNAAPLCFKYGVPAVFFVNASCIDSQELALDNLICYVVNVLGMAQIHLAMQAVTTRPQPTQIRSMGDVFMRFLPGITLEQRQTFRGELLGLIGAREAHFAEEANLYLTREKLRALLNSNFEIGNHTYTHVHCRCLSKAGLRDEIDQNKSELERTCGRRVRSFSVPYGSAEDLTDELAGHLWNSGHQAVFLSGSVANSRGQGPFRFDRVSARANNDGDLFGEIEVLPRLRAMRNLLF
jgi:peptidoglycan/xylan/chitin deacetylase (PgdA/CDA1 family)